MSIEEWVEIADTLLRISEGRTSPLVNIDQFEKDARRVIDRHQVQNPQLLAPTNLQRNPTDV